MHKQLRVTGLEEDTFVGSARLATFKHLPAVLRELGVDVRDVIKEARIRVDLSGSPDERITYPEVGRLLAAAARHTNCDYIGLLIGQRTRLADMGLAGRIALCAATAEQGLQKFVAHFALQNTAATLNVVTSGGFTRLVYAVNEPAMKDTGSVQLGAMAIGFNILQNLCGTDFSPTVVTVASRAPTNLKPCQKFFRSPLRFESDESGLYFESRWLDRPLAPVDRLVRRDIEAQVRVHRDTYMADLPRNIRHVLRRQLSIGDVSMDHVASRLEMHRRTLDRRLKLHGLIYRDVLESVKKDLACQLLRDTDMPMRAIAESLLYTSAANFSTAFRHWTGVTPSAYRQREATSATERYGQRDKQSAY